MNRSKAEAEVVEDAAHPLGARLRDGALSAHLRWAEIRHRLRHVQLVVLSDRREQVLGVLGQAPESSGKEEVEAKTDVAESPEAPRSDPEPASPVEPVATTNAKPEPESPAREPAMADAAEEDDADRPKRRGWWSIGRG